MPKSIMLDPEILLKPDRIQFADMEVNAYAKTTE